MTLLVRSRSDFLCRPRRETRDDVRVLDTDAIADIEGTAQYLLRSAGLPDDEPPSPIAIAIALTGAPPLIARMRHEACVATIDGEARIVVRHSVIPSRRRWLVGHECAEHYLRSIGYDGEDIEDRADAIGAALMLPRAAMRSLMRVHGHRVHTIARLTNLTQSLVLLRVGEVSGSAHRARHESRRSPLPPQPIARRRRGPEQNDRARGR